MGFDWNKVCSASDYTKNISDSFGKVAGKVSVLWMQNNRLASKCETFNKELQQDIKDMQNYVLDIEDFYDEIANLQETSENKIEDRKNRMAELQEKQQNGTITKSEAMELEILAEEIESIGQETESRTFELNGFITTKIDKMPTLENKNNISTDYANKTLEVSEEFRNQNHSGHEYYRANQRISASELADSAKEAAEKLLETVDISVNTMNIFSKKSE